MFEFFSGWRKASKCKNLIRFVQCRLKFLRIKRNSIIRQLRDDIAQLLKNGHYETAFSRVEQLFQDQNLLAVYDLLDHFCEFVIVHIPYIRKHKDCPNDVNEAVSTLIFAADWCGDLPELKIIQKLFGERYGHKFAKAAVNLHPGTLVNNQVREKLCIKSIPDDARLRLIDEITKEYSLQQGILDFDNRLKLNPPKSPGNNGCQWEGFVFKGEAEVNYNSLYGEHILASSNKGELTDSYFNSNPAKLIVQPLQVIEMHRSAAKVEDCVQVERFCQPDMNLNLLPDQSSSGICTNKPCTVSLDNMLEMGSIVPTAEIPFQIHKSIVKFDEVREFQFSRVQDQYGEDKRTFLFNSSIFPSGDCNTFCGASCLFFSHGYGEFENDRPGACNRMPTQAGRSSSFVCNENLWSFQQLHTRMAQKHICCDKIMQGDIPSSKCKLNHSKPYCMRRVRHDMDYNCSLERPCYCSVAEFHNDILVKKCKKLRGPDISDFSACCFSCHGSCSRGSSPRIQIETGACVPSARTVTICPGKLKSTATEKNLHSDTSNFGHSERSTTSSFSHVHPKLPDYDELAAKFMALKKEHQQRAAKTSQG